MSKKRLIIIGLVVLAIAGLGFVLTNKYGTQKNNSSQQQFSNNQATPKTEQISTGVQKGQLAPDFEFTTIEGEKKKLSDFRGQPVVFGFILTTGCTPCAEEAKILKQVQDKNSLKVIQIVVSSIEPKRNIENFKQYLGGPDWLMAYDNSEELTKLFKVRAVDTTIMVDKDGKIIYRDDGYPAKADELEAALKTI